KVVLTTEYDLSARGGEGFESRSLVVAGQLVRAHGLAKLFGLPSLAPPGPRPFLVMEVDAVRFALSVDRLMGQEEVVMKPLFPPPSSAATGWTRSSPPSRTASPCNSAPRAAPACACWSSSPARARRAWPTRWWARTPARPTSTAARWPRRPTSSSRATSPAWARRWG